MKILLVIVIIVLIAAVWIGYPIIIAIKKSKTLESAAVAFQRHNPGASMRILILGDSTAVGTGAGDSNFSTAGRLAARYPEADIETVAENGLKIEGLIEKVRELPDETYDLVLIQIGANDIVRFTSMTLIRSGLSELLDLAEEKGSKIVILHSGNIGLSPAFRFPVSAVMSERTCDVRALYMNEDALREKVQYVDLYKEKKDDVFLRSVDKYYAPDRFHPSADGYGIWFDEIMKVVEKGE